jgi:3-oxoacyl-[acyl-carrier protein] reductase
VAIGWILARLTGDVAGDEGATIEIGGRTLPMGLKPQLPAQMEAMTPLGRACTPEEAAGAIYLLCTPESDFITGQVILCAGGLAP